MATVGKPVKTLPTILTKRKVLKDLTIFSDCEDTDRNDDPGGLRLESGRVDFGLSSSVKSNAKCSSTTRIAWADQRDTASSAGSLINIYSKVTPKSKSVTDLTTSAMSPRGPNKSTKQFSRKTGETEEYTSAPKLLRQKLDIATVYIGTPVTDAMATSREILRFLYKLWETQLCISYRENARITSPPKQDLCSARKTVPDKRTHLAKQHSAVRGDRAQTKLERKIFQRHFSGRQKIDRSVTLYY